MHADAELPDELAELAAERLMAASAEEHDAVLAELVQAHPQHAEALRRLPRELAGARRLLDGAYPDPSTAPRTIGDHRVIRTLGEGAFGTVYLGEQQRPVVRQVAIKVLRPGVGDDRTLRRFAAEGQVLASLNHPSITHIFDASTLPDGRPYFVMEYVDGANCRRYCEHRALDCRARLQLFLALCRGVSHAHKRGVVHRDLKPANVLVVDTEAGPMPKIIDFGIAKVLATTTRPEPGQTEPGRVIGTPGYMSPEQAAGDLGTVDARADVWALGVMLYETLTGELPWPASIGATGSDPLRPSVRVTRARSATQGPEAVAPRPLAAELRGDLDWITLHALAHDPAERYPSVDALAADIERHLRGETVSVGPPGIAYRLRKFVRRHRVVMLAAAVALAVSTGGSMFSFWYGRAARGEVASALAEAEASSRRLTQLAERLLARANDPALREAPRGDTTRLVLLQEANATYEQFLQVRPNEPELLAGRSRALLSLSQVHWLLGEAAASGAAASAAAADAEVLCAVDPARTEWQALLASARQRQGHALRLQRDEAGAHARFAEAARLLTASASTAPGRHELALAAARREAAMSLPEGELARRLDELRSVLAALTQAEANQPDAAAWAAEFLETTCSLAEQLRSQDANEEAYGFLAQAAAMLPRIGTMRLGRTELVQRRQAMLAWSMRESPGRAEAALQHAQSAIEAATAWQQEQPQQRMPQVRLAQGLALLGYMQNYREDFAGASASYRSAIASHEALVGRFPEDATRRAALVGALAEFALALTDRFRQCDLDEASALCARAVAQRALVASADQPQLQARWRLQALQVVIEQARQHGDVDAACEALAAELAQTPTVPTMMEKDDLLGAWASLARWHLDAGRHGSAVPWLAKAQALGDGAAAFGKRMLEIGWLSARVAAARGDHAACADAAARVAAARRSWLATKRTGDCLFLAWRCAVAATSTPSQCADYSRRAAVEYERAITTLDEDVTRAPQDPWYVLPWGFMRLRAAAIAAGDGDPATAREHLAKALPRLEAVRSIGHADQWDDDAWREGLALRDRLAAGR